MSSHSRLGTSTANVFHSDTTGSIMFFLENTSADPYGLMMDFSQAAADDNTNHFLKLEDSSAERCIIFSDGDVKNHDNSYGSLSDERIKDNITDANSQWDDIKAIKIRNYNFKSSTGWSTHKQIGVVAQELELTSPGLVSTSYETDNNDSYKVVAQSIIYMKAVKCLQEAIAKIETLETKVAALEAA